MARLSAHGPIRRTLLSAAAELDTQALALTDVPFYPLGQYFQPTAYQRSITGVLNGFATFWSVRPSA